MIAAALVPSAPARAAGGVEFGDTGYELSFGEYINFSLEATVSESPQRVWLVYRLEDERADNVAAATFREGRTLRAEYLWELYPGDMAPGCTVYYRWAVETADGSWVESEEHTFVYDDLRFDWRVVEREPLSVYYYKSESLAEEILDAGTDALDRLAEDMGVETREPISIYVYANERDMQLALPSRSETYDEATVTLGMAMDHDTLLLLGRSADASLTAAHELSHIVVGRMTDNPFNDLPRWLDEGLAMYAEGELGAGNREALEDAIRSGNVLSLRSMTSYPGDPGLVDLYYGEAYSLAEYMLTAYSPEQMRQLLGELGKGESMEAALQTVYGLTLSDIEAGWRESVGLGAPAGDAGEQEEQAPAATPTPVRGGIH